MLHGLDLGSRYCTTREDFIISDGKNTVRFKDDRCDSKDDILNSLKALLN